MQWAVGRVRVLNLGVMLSQLAAQGSVTLVLIPLALLSLAGTDYYHGKVKQIQPGGSASASRSPSGTGG
jgi:hypothetical protein